MYLMKNRLRVLALACALLIPGQAAIGAGLSESAALQAAMQQYIERNLVDGAYLTLNRQTGEVERLYPLKAHPLIMQMGEQFVLCSDFNDSTGKSVNVDFYFTRSGDTYVVVAAAVDDRAMLERWMKEGKVRPLD